MTTRFASTARVGRRGMLAGCTAAALAGLTRRAAGSPKFRREDVTEAGLVGTLFLPADPTGMPGVVCLTGAMGGLWEAPARALARDGVPALALAVHNYEGRPPTLRLLPVEYVVTAVEWLRHRAGTDAIALRGWSRGGELALLAASLTPAINAVISYAPRCYVAREQNKQNNFGDPNAAAAFTWQGAPVDGVPLPEAMRVDRNKPSFEELHGIAVERIAGPVMLVSGLADTGIAGTTAEFSCAQAMRRLDLFKSPHRHIHYSYPDAGHSIAGPPPFTGPAEEGGTAAGDAAAVADAWPRGIEFLRSLGA